MKNKESRIAQFQDQRWLESGGLIDTSPLGLSWRSALPSMARSTRG
jgi:hypothetical protein